MNRNTLALLTASLSAAAALSLAACNSNSDNSQPAVSGAAEIETATMTATVVAVDPAKRHVTLQGPAGNQRTYTLSKDVVNFDQIKVGDKVSATVADELAVVIRKQGAPPSAGEGQSVALARVGAKPGIMMADTVQVTAKVIAVNSWSHAVTLQYVDGSTHVIKASKNVDLTGLQVGDSITAWMTEALAVVVEKP